MSKAKHREAQKRAKPIKEDLNTKQELLLAALLEGRSRAEAAKKAGLTPTYVRQMLMESNTDPAAVKLRTALGTALEALREQSTWTAQRLIEEHEDQYHTLKEDYPEIACRHLIELGKIVGVYVTKHEHHGKLSVADIIGSVSDEELAGAE